MKNHATHLETGRTVHPQLQHQTEHFHNPICLTEFGFIVYSLLSFPDS